MALMLKTPPFTQQEMTKTQQIFYDKSMPEFKLRLPCRSMDEVHFIASCTNARKFFIRVMPLVENSPDTAVRIVMGCLAGHFTELAKKMAATRKANREYAVPAELLNAIIDLLMTVYGGTRQNWTDKFRYWRSNTEQKKRISSYFYMYSIKKEHRKHWQAQHQSALIDHRWKLRGKKTDKEFSLQYPDNWNDHMFLQTEMPISNNVVMTLPVAPAGWNFNSDEFQVPGELPDMDEYRETLKKILEGQSPLHPQPDLIPGSPEPEETGPESGRADATAEQTEKEPETSPGEIDTEKTTSELETSDPETGAKKTAASSQGTKEGDNEGDNTGQGEKKK